MCANFASVVVFPVPFIPTNKITYGSCNFFFALIFSKISILPVASNKTEILSIRLFFTNDSISCLSTLVPIRLFLRSDLRESMTSVATSDSSNEISSCWSILFMSFSDSSFSLKLFATFEKALRKFSNMVSLLFLGSLCLHQAIHFMFSLF